MRALPLVKFSFIKCYDSNELRDGWGIFLERTTVCEVSLFSSIFEHIQVLEHKGCFRLCVAYLSD